MKADYDDENPSYMGKLILALALLAVALIAYFVWQYTKSNDAPKSVSLPAPVVNQPVVEAEPEQEPEPEPVAEVEPEPTPEPLPSLDASDRFVLDRMANLSAGDALVKLVIPDNVILKSVRAVMALDEGNVVHDNRTLQAPAAPFKVTKSDEPLDNDVGQRYTLSAENDTRYKPWVSVVTQLDKKSIATLYQRAYPLLEEAYLQHGVDRGSFHNVLLGVIDNMLAAPVLDEEIVLVQPKVFFQYEDPALEKAPQTHRLLWRMGPENTRAIQASLRELKRELLALNIPRESKRAN